MDRRLECEHGERMTGLMSLALDGSLGEGDRQRLEEHVAACSACQAEWLAMKQVAALFEGSPMVGPPLGFAIRVERRLAEEKKKRRRVFGGIAVLTGSLSLAGLTVVAVLAIALGVITWNQFDASPSARQGSEAVSQVASGMGLVGKGASLFLGDLLRQYGAPLVLCLALGLMVLVGAWAWLVLKRPGDKHHNGYA